MKKILIIFAIIIIAIFTVIFFIAKNEKKYLTINDKKIKIEIVTTSDLQYKGLSNRDKICDDCGMLFVFQDKAVRTFVMREMRFPLDIIWLDNNKIVRIDKNLPPEGKNYVNRYSSIVPINNVLEVNAGFTDKYGIKIGNEIK